MNLGRPTVDPKPYTLKLRLNSDMREWVERSADRRDMTMSEYIRWLIEADMNGDVTSYR